MAVALRIMRALGDVASAARDPDALGRLELHARLLDATVRTAFAGEDCDELARRRAVVSALTAR
jgi:hypothetical protein